MTGKKILVGRSRLSVDFAIVLRLRDMENMGWSRMAQAYRKITGQIYKSRHHQAHIPGSKGSTARGVGGIDELEWHLTIKATIFCAKD